MNDVLKLPATLDVARARGVLEDLSNRQGAAITIDASKVEKVSALAIEILIAGQRQWAKDGLAFDIADMSIWMSDTWAGLGLDPAHHREPATIPDTTPVINTSERGAP